MPLSEQLHQVFPLPDSVVNLKPPDPLWTGHTHIEVPIVVDFGSYHVRAGFANQSDPFLDFPSIYARYRPNTINSNILGHGGISMNGHDEESGTLTAVGNDILYLPPATRKISPFDLNVPYHQDGVEYLLDHILSHLLNKNHSRRSLIPMEEPYSLMEDSHFENHAKPSASFNTSRSISNQDYNWVGDSASNRPCYDHSMEHAIVLTEAPLTPKYSRKLLLQLIFECYAAPQCSLGIDALFALLYDHTHDYRGARVSTQVKPQTSSSVLYQRGSASHCEWTVGSKGLSHLGSSSRTTIHVGPLGRASSSSHTKSSFHHSCHDHLSDSSSLCLPPYALVVSSGFETTHILPIQQGELIPNRVLRQSMGGHDATETLNKSIQRRYPEHRPIWNRIGASAGLSSGYAISEAIKEQHGMVALDYDQTLDVLQIQLNYLKREAQLVATNQQDNWQGEQPPLDWIQASESCSVRHIQLPYEPRTITPITDEERSEREAKREKNAIRLRAMMRQRREEGLRNKIKRQIELEREGISPVQNKTKQYTIQENARIWLELKTNAIRTLDEILLDLAPPSLSTKGTTTTTTAVEESYAWQVQKLAERYPLTVRYSTSEACAMDDEDEDEWRIQHYLYSWTMERLTDKHQVISSGPSMGNGTGPQAVDSPNPSQDISAISITALLAKQVSECTVDELLTMRNALRQRLTPVDIAGADGLPLNTGAMNPSPSSASNLSQPLSAPTFTSGSSSRRGCVAKSRERMRLQQEHELLSDQSDDEFLAQLQKQTQALHLLHSSASTSSSQYSPVVHPLDTTSAGSNTTTTNPNASLMVGGDQDPSSRHTNGLGTNSSSIAQDRLAMERVQDELLLRLDPASLRRREAQEHQITLDVDRLRLAELIFQPSLLGRSQQGLIEMLYTVLEQYGISQSLPLLKHIYLTGGNANWLGLAPRILHDLTPLLPSEWTRERQVRVIQASNPSLGAWRGAALFANSSHCLNKYFLTKQEYLEEGPERANDLVQSHFAANKH